MENHRYAIALHFVLLHILSANIFRLIKSCQTTIHRLGSGINTVAGKFASRGVFAGSTLISALSFRMARHNLISIESTENDKGYDCEGTSKKYGPQTLTQGLFQYIRICFRLLKWQNVF